MREVKITVLKTGFNRDLAEKYGAPGLGPCTAHRVGEEFVSTGGKPEGFREEAWTAIGKYVFALAMGAPGFWTTWVNRDGLAINTCNDGLRPVVLKLERIEG